MAIREELTLDISQALNQLNDLERELDGLFAPVSRGDNEFEALNRELDQTVTELKQIDNQAERTGRELETTGKRGTTAFSGLSNAFLGFAGAVAAFSGFQTIGRGLALAVGAASDLAESTSKARVVFGGFIEDIETFAGTAPQALGLSNRAALEFTATFGNLFVALGLSQQAAAELSPEIVQLGADLASFNNIGVEEALEKLRSGLVGEAEPLRALGVNINEAVTSAKALELGLVGANGQISEAAKVQARYALILEQTATAQGDFARTADGVANTQRTLTAEWENAQAAIGNALLPAYQEILQVLPELISKIEDLGPAIEVVAGVALTSVEALADFAGVLGDVAVFAADMVALAPEILGLGAAAGEGGGGIERFKDAALNALNPLNGLGDAISDIELSLAGVSPTGFRNVIEDLTEAAEQGVNPLQSLGLALAEFTANSELTAEGLEAIIAASRIQGEDLTFFLSNTIKNADRLKISAAGVRVLKDALVELQDFTRRTPGDGQLPGSNPADAPVISATAAAILELSQAGQSLEDFSPDLGAAGFVDGLDGLTTAMSGAQEALKDDEGQIVDDLDSFLTNLNEVFNDQLDFAQNIAVLRQRGLDLLADAFKDAGLAAAGALADAVADPAAAAEANAAIVEQGAALARAEFSAFDTELKQAIAGYNPEAVVIPLEFGPFPTFAAPGTVGGIPTFTGGGTTVTNNFYTEPQPTTNTQRINQSMQQIRQ